MTTTDVALPVDRPPVGLPRPTVATAPAWRHAVTDSVVVAGRYLRHLVRVPQLLVFATIQPVLFVLMFTYVFGGQFEIPGFASYTDFLMPGIFVQTVAFGATQTGIGLADDAGSGMVQRFQTLPMARSALLVGRTLSDLVRNTAVVVLMLVVGVAVGFRPSGAVLGWVGAVLLVLLFAYAMSWLTAVIGLSAGSVEAAEAATFPLMFPLVFASSAFTPTDAMPGWLQAWTNNQPVTQVVDATRGLLNGGAEADVVLRAVLWCVAMVAVFAPIAVRRYRAL